MSLSAEEKERFLKALEEDRVFRYSVMGLLGFKELLDRFTRLEERQARLEERQERLEERFLKLEERQRILEERQLRLEERQQKLEERFARLEEEFIKLAKMVDRIEADLKEVRRIVGHTRRDVGALAEVLYSRIVWEDLREEIRERGETIIRRNKNFIVDNVEVDLLVETDKAVYVVEIKVQPNHHDVNNLVKKAEIVRTRFDKRCVPVLAGTWIGDDVRRYARGKDVVILEY